MPAGGFVVCGFVVCGTGGACDVEMEERNDGVGDGEEERRTGEDRELGVRALKKTGYPHGRPVRFCHRSFHRREFSGFPRRWISIAPEPGGLALRRQSVDLHCAGIWRICTVSALVWGGAVLLLERAALANGQISVMPIPGRLASRWLLSRRCLVGSRTVHKGITACARPGRPREIPVPGFSFWRPGG